MTTTHRALVFALVSASALLFAVDAAVAEPTEVIRLETVVVTAHRASFQQDAGQVAATRQVAPSAS